MSGAVKFYLSPFGRISRKWFWLAYLVPITLISIGSLFADETFFIGLEFDLLGEPYGPLSLAVLILSFWPSLAVSIKRFHDLNMTGWWNLAFLPLYLWYPDTESFFNKFLWNGLFQDNPLFGVGIIGIAIVIGLAILVLILLQLFKPGQLGENRFGEDPLGRERRTASSADNETPPWAN